jgi:ATP-dependent DNA ligase
MERKASPEPLSRETFRSIFPPRARAMLPASRLGELRGYIGQFKYDDVRTLIILWPGGEIELLTRHRVPHRLYRLTPAMLTALRRLRLSPDRCHVLDGGVLRHFAVNGVRPIILWDILVHDNQHLIGTTYATRYALLHDLCGSPVDLEQSTGYEIGIEITPELWLAPSFSGDFQRLFERTYGNDLLEGLLLKNPRGKLEHGLNEANNTTWQIKVRKRPEGSAR